MGGLLRDTKVQYEFIIRHAQYIFAQLFTYSTMNINPDHRSKRTLPQDGPSWALILLG